MTKRDMDNEFEYNDGLGDLLREKQRLEFSWLKSLVVIGGLGAFCIIAVLFLSKLTNTFLLDTPSIEPLTQSELSLPSHTMDSGTNALNSSLPDHSKSNATINNNKTSRPLKTTIATTPKPSSSQAMVKRKTTSTPQNLTASRTRQLESNSVYRVIVGTFMNPGNAHRMVSQLKKKNISSYVWSKKGQRKTIYRVQVGAFKELNVARKLESKMKSRGIDAYTFR